MPLAELGDVGTGDGDRAAAPVPDLLVEQVGAGQAARGVECGLVVRVVRERDGEQLFGGVISIFQHRKPGPHLVPLGLHDPRVQQEVNGFRLLAAPLKALHRLAPSRGVSLGMRQLLLQPRILGQHVANAGGYFLAHTSSFRGIRLTA